MSQKLRISFQGAPGAFSDIAARQLYPDGEMICCPSFREALICLAEGRADCAVIPVTNTTAGPVTNALALLREGRYTVAKSCWQPIRHCLLALPQAQMENIRSVHSHWQALAQCRINIEKLGLEAVEEGDTAGAARQIAQGKDATKAAIASALAAQEYGLQVLKENFEDKPDNKTLFLAIARKDNPQAESLGTVEEMLRQLGLI